MSGTMKVGVICDWSYNRRTNDWETLIRNINKAKYLTSQIEYISYPLADWLLDKTKEPAEKVPLGDLQALIINWDTANGDPEYGSHLNQAWLRHKQPEILVWVQGGRVLIIEGQATLSVPSQGAYDALLGINEMPVCGPEDPYDPKKQEHRNGARCIKSCKKLNSHKFEALKILKNQRGKDLTFDYLFKNPKFITGHIEETKWDEVLYRGWFRRRFPWQTHLKWVSIFKTDDRSFWKNHSTMQVAKVGEGAIFATTMFLATTDQRALVAAMLNCAEKNIGHLPDPNTISTISKSYGSHAVKFCAAFLTSFFLTHYDPMLHQFADATSRISPYLNYEAVSSHLTLLIWALLFAIILIFSYGYTMFRRIIADFIGY